MGMIGLKLKSQPKILDRALSHTALITAISGVQTGHLSGLTGTAGQNQTLPHYADTTCDKNLTNQSPLSLQQRARLPRRAKKWQKFDEVNIGWHVCGSGSTAGKRHIETHYSDAGTDKIWIDQSQDRRGSEWKPEPAGME